MISPPSNRLGVSRKRGAQPPCPEPSSPSTSVGVRALVVAAVGILLIVVTGLAALPTSVVEVRETAFAELLDDVAPQGWAFFTRPPREVTVAPLVATADGWKDAFIGPNAQPRFVMGLDRSPRLQELELSPLVEPLLGHSWVECRRSEPQCIDAAPVVQVVNQAGHPTLCGAVAFVRSAPVPWAWARAGMTDTVVEAIRAEVRCEAIG